MHKNMYYIALMSSYKMCNLFNKYGKMLEILIKFYRYTTSLINVNMYAKFLCFMIKC